MNYIIKNILCIVLLSSIIVACKRDDAYKDFLKDGTKTYPGKPLKINGQAGKNRAKLSWIIVDPKVDRFVVYWNNRKDSVIVPGTITGETADTVHVLLEDLNEDSYLFNVLSVDKQGNRSIEEEVQVSVYGDIYVQSLLNRGLKSATSMGGVATLIWGTSEETEAAVEISYLDNSGILQKVLMSNADTIINLANYKNGNRFSYKTLFVPDSTAIDTVESSTLTPAAPDIIYPLLDKSKFAEKNLPTDQPDAWGWKMFMLWDNSISEGNGFHTAEVTFPYHFTFDTGVTASLHEMKMWQRQSQFYTGANPRYFEVWGSTNPAPDGSWTGWTKLLVCESIKPSGLKTGYTLADENYAKAGESFIFPDDSPPVRYIRIKSLGNWAGSNPGATHIMELNFYSN